MTSLKWVLMVLMGVLGGPTMAQDEAAPNRRPVSAVADGRIDVGGRGVLPLYVSKSWTAPQ